MVAVVVAEAAALALRVVEPDTGRTYTVAESGSVHLIREGDR